MSDIDPETGIPRRQLAWLRTTCVHFVGAGNVCKVGRGTLGFTLLNRPCIGAHPQNCEKYQAPTQEEYDAEIASLREHRRVIGAAVDRINRKDFGK